MIEVKQLQVVFKNKSIRYHDMVFEHGKSYFIYGDSGGGKSTLVKHLSLLENSDAISYNGVDFTKFKKEKEKFKRKNIGIYLSEKMLVDDLTVSDHLSLVGKVDYEKLKNYGLLPLINTKVKHLSSGEKQRLGVLIALMKDGCYKFFDEPTSHVNKSLSDMIINGILDNHNKNKGITVVVSHDLSYKHLFDVVINISDVCDVVEEVV